MSARSLSRCFTRELAFGDRDPEQDLDVDLVIGGRDARGVVDRIGVDASAGERVLDAPALGEPEVAAFADDLAAQARAVHAYGVVGAIAHLGVGFGRSP